MFISLMLEWLCASILGSYAAGLSQFCTQTDSTGIDIIKYSAVTFYMNLK
jgi:hypothetical protein